MHHIMHTEVLCGLLSFVCMYTKSQLTQGSLKSSVRTFGDKKHFYLLIIFEGKVLRK